MLQCTVVANWLRTVDKIWLFYSIKSRKWHEKCLLCTSLFSCHCRGISVFVSGQQQKKKVFWQKQFRPFPPKIFLAPRLTKGHIIISNSQKQINFCTYKTTSFSSWFTLLDVIFNLVIFWLFFRDFSHFQRFRIFQ